ncbi:dihydrofolate reductase family protein [Ornithinimicrobium faecis]|uniref:Dihydrofolate reductase family protein n=1 Tax=Ornithinimicrobium faecis TaxID=2934158 RepID=A0ABY4YZP5_9MICO|nr:MULTISPECIES: dihydrofolate reductase family protein [unclassified Ornithinimicrobium]USQ82273.1 dihydrofolate reductase family protein [Ornithinimicrobium sp. HY1793]
MPVIVSNIISLDGNYEGPDGNPMGLNMDGAFDAYNLERICAAGTVLLGRRSFEMFSGHWPGVAEAPADPQDLTLSAVNREMSRRYNAIPKLVASDSYAPPADNPWHDTTEVVSGADLADRVRTERDRGVGDVLIFGSRALWHSLLGQGLVDELHLMISPGALGGGTPVFADPCDLTLIDSRGFEDSGNVLLRYAARA